jgi:hypothetical protein
MRGRLPASNDPRYEVKPPKQRPPANQLAFDF